MNRYTQVDILYEHVSRQPLQSYKISRSSVKGQEHLFRKWTKVCRIVFTERD